ncbi:MAG: DUF418 domain-containing protein [Bacteroidota bacterium]
MSKKRIIGIDVARALAIFGMIIVNFKLVLGQAGGGFFKYVAQVFEGKAAALFVVLAGVGIALVFQSAKDSTQQDRIRKSLMKRALLLFVLGYSYIVIWPADILHFYGIYMVVTILLLRRSDRTVFMIAGFFILLFPMLLTVLDYETAWNFETFEYAGFWTLEGFFRNLFFNGFHPVVPWTAFMLFGLWLGRRDLRSDAVLSRLFWRSLLGILLLQGGAMLCTKLVHPIDEELMILLGTDPMPPLPIYMLLGMSVATFVMVSCILLTRHRTANPVVQALSKTGKLALTFYVAHVVIGMLAVELIWPKTLGTYSIQFSVLYALLFSLACIVFAVFWLRFRKMGPLEWGMRKLTA